MNPLERIAIDPAVRFGKPGVRGTRVSVGDVLEYLAGGMSEDEILADFPQLTRDDIRACLAYAAERERRTLRSAAPRRREMARLLFDEPLSEKLCDMLADVFPGSLHIRLLGHGGAEDATVWEA